MGDQAERQLAARVDRWREAFSDEVTGIQRTTDDLLWKYASFRMAVRIVHLANQSGRNNPPINQMLFNLIADGYWSHLLLAVRRLLDKGHLRGRDGVYSLRAVLSDIRVCRRKLTRAVYVELVRGAKYDLQQLRDEQWERLVVARGKPVWGDPALIRSELAHSDFDKISGVDPGNRSADDLISEEIFSKLEIRLARLDAIGDHVSSHVAHAGNAESRKGKSLDRFDIRDAREALKELKQISDAIGLWFLGEGGAGLAVYIGDQFEALDKPLVSSSGLTDLEEQWRLIDQDISGWTMKIEDL